MKNLRLYAILGPVAAILLIPFVAMQFSSEVNWSISDFVVAGVLLTGAALTIAFVLQKFPRTSHRIAFSGLVLLVLALVWAELAVGIFLTPFAGS